MSDGFTGAKIALLCEGQTLVYLRDDKPDIPWAALWDLPGGGRENDETPTACALRETHEEFGLTLDPVHIVWSRRYPAALDASQHSWFLVAELPAGSFRDVVFGDEGQRWEVMPVETYLALPDGIAHLQQRLRDYLNSRA